ncbi:hypothetical protein [Streptomyces sp. DH37]|uniref:hypothetical protein n=1 Tax=Streptomyces sp. DH37 TaxID=3040122 RepID=UPI002441515F|nr:hypothetical protein [Streptomyces sp. DH37]MDG9701888.1 hypothetical protein [Streptomyces sp. DH37]
MAEQDKHHDQDLAEIARERNRHLSGETAKGRVDPAAAGGRAGEETSRGTDAPRKGKGNVQGTGNMPRSGADLGDRSTGGEAAREAIGADPAESGGEVEDRSTGKSTREETFGDGGKS